MKLALFDRNGSRSFGRVDVAAGQIERFDVEPGGRVRVEIGGIGSLENPVKAV